MVSQGLGNSSLTFKSQGQKTRFPRLVGGSTQPLSLSIRVFKALGTRVGGPNRLGIRIHFIQWPQETYGLPIQTLTYATIKTRFPRTWDDR